MAFEYFGAHEQIRADMAFGGRRTVFRGFRVIYLSVNNLLLFALPKYRNSYALRTSRAATVAWRGGGCGWATEHGLVLGRGHWGGPPPGAAGGFCLLERPCRSKRAGQNGTAHPVGAALSHAF